MKIENTKAQMRKGVLEFCILSVLKNDDAYVAEILSTLKDAKLLVVEGTIYPLLTRLKNAGLLSYRWEESTSGPPRKYYGLTETGKLFLKELDSTWSELKNAVNIVTNHTETHSAQEKKQENE
ncbi:PadR family transcriptional regulator [Seonamhaeicola marinus]|uniref:PadR family transcriptional regulator n=1 Tax=Seonamhaeicola marinus TaxID=1912246 RepID=A0A5D0IPJ5_9FLAO|nr:PadR family transcriptional regulator [Seonamhaeicola marinus]TYA84287.1 PadR family transcriptional regulator [Seonamhaeicola marinus]